MEPKPHDCKYTAGLYGVLSIIDAADLPVEGQTVIQDGDTESRRKLSREELDELVTDIYGYVEYVLQ